MSSSGSVDWRTTRDILVLEGRFKENLADMLKEIKKSYRFGEYEINEVSTTWKIQNREPDITVFVQNQPFLIIECKRAIDHSPWDDFPIGQAYTYALLAKKEGYSVDFVATANQYYMAIFRVPEDLENYVNWEAIRNRQYDRAFRRELYLKAKAGDLCVMDFGYHFLPPKEKLYELCLKLIKERKELRPEPFRYRVIKRLRSFVEFVSEQSKDLIKSRINNILQNEFLALRKRRGVRLKYKQVSKEFAYSIMNRILFYKVLERSWRGLEKLKPLYNETIDGMKIDDGEKYFRVLKTFFKRAVEVTGDFEPVFILDFHDKLILPSYVSVLKAIDGLIQDLDNIELERLGDVIGYVYEEIIDPQERHQLGQFYTPHGVAELIAKWGIRSPSDLILDPGSGSGTFLVEAYRRLYELKTGKRLEGIAEKDIHEQIVKQLYAIDIDEFACHLSTMNISLRNVLHPSREINIIPSDFFLIEPEQEVLLPYKVSTVEGLVERKITLPKVDCVVGNPPYTAWDEILDNTKDLIRKKLDKMSEKFNLKPKGGVRQRQNPHIYVYWIMHATKFLKPNGRLGMIISNLWLQTDYGVKFGNFLLDNFKIRAIIDIQTLRLFTALITTTIVLLEKCDNEDLRKENEVVFIRIPTSVEDVDVEELLNAINNKRCDKFPVNCIKQRDISRSGKWIKYFFKSVLLLEKSPKSCPLSDLYDVCKGNTTWHMLTNGAGDGATPFFHLTPEIVERENLHGYVYPAITDVRDMKFFTFKRRDWEVLRDKNKRCYMFICHKPRSELDQNILKYIEWGERDCRVSRRRGQGEICCRTSACRNREERDEFYGWYDLGGVKPAQILAVYQAWYKTRFALCEFPVATYHAILCFFPKVELTKDQLKALLAYLNSSFAQFYVETEGRKSGGGIIALEISQAERMSVLDPRKLSEEEIKGLADLFDKLEVKAREIGGATEREQ
ncbi:MAG: N-6 DNA methylase, partial [archaeon GB-1867-097]|nr:N-6 DNA methylase [Candidatus Culexmicrobium thermophilum]